MTTKPLTLREISLFFFPLMLNVQFMSVSHSFINAALARQQDPVTSLAAFSVAMVLHMFVAAPSYQNQAITIAMVRGRKSLRATWIFVLLTAVYVATLLALLAWTPIGDFVLYRFLGVEEKVGVEVQAVLAILVPLPFLTGARGLLQGLVIQARRTGLVSTATGIRIGALLAFLALGAPWLSGARLAAFALLGCIAVETLFAAWFARHCRIDHQGAQEHSLGEIFRFSLPLAFSSSLQYTIPLLINAIISRLPDGPLALAAFGVIRGFLFLLAGPLRNLQQAYQTLIRNAADYPALLRFHRRVSGFLAVLLLLTAYPLNGPILGTVMGLDAEMRAYIALPLASCALFPIFHGASNLLRGIFTQNHQTGMLGRATLYKFFYLLICWGLILLWTPPIPGVAVAIFLIVSAELLELIYMHLRCRARLPEAFAGVDSTR
ncbi:Na+-driven multidrug efflux pump [Geoalkalibacter ferrihydriticus]|uniref:Na+-driven multidrug efflux pump n=1 Tax=Geoalkalibacter ferrihydriticus TaxID=392333 RepID=A0A1G9IC07_9BACT|nr:hypothetical protein [Geoalkalibacter ferrihydriticus]SDL22384.1 Na+-driven multidrug efflux pump [Geoalkalibacter ferrihydriticus]